MSERTHDRVNERTGDARAVARCGTWLRPPRLQHRRQPRPLLRKPWATLLTVGVMALALALPLGLWLVLGNVARLRRRACRPVARRSTCS